MKKRFTIYSVLISFMATALMLSLGLMVTSSDNKNQAKDSVIAIANIYADIYDEGYDTVVKSDENIRITVIDSEGNVIADTDVSDLSSLGNHLEREEVQSAMSGSPKAVIRHSDTYGGDMIYYAVKKDVPGGHVFIRAAIPVSSINEYLIKTLPLTIAILFLAVVISVIAGLFFGDRLLKPLENIKRSLSDINAGKYSKMMPVKFDAEIDKMLGEIDDIGGKLELNVRSLKEEQAKLDFILNNINDAVIVVDGGKNICLINDIAKNLFDCAEALGKSINSIEYDQKLFAAVGDSIGEGRNSVFESEIGNAVYLVTVKTLSAGWAGGKKLCAVILSDITSVKDGEKMRSEFFANANHELKSPLTAIMGFSEILGLENSNEKLDPCILKIKKESERMSALVDDMLRLSYFETATLTDKKYVDLRSVAQNVLADLEPQAAEKNVTVSISGDAYVSADPDHMYSLIKNLAENAVRYNKNGGRADIDLFEDERAVRLKVTDTGIGVESKHQSRIFERFYRIEKSRSRQAGGTGLGLSIVKHICRLYGADISLKSKIGMGTAITVIFKKV